MKKLYFLFALFILPSFLKAQAPDVPCFPDVFYGLGGNYVHKLSLSGGAITDLGAVTNVSGSNIYSLAYGEDITMGSTNRTFYSTRGTSTGVILRYNGTTWDSICGVPLTYFNAGAYGRFVYFQRNSPVGQPNTQVISRLLPDGTLHPIFTDTSLIMSVADIAVDSIGRVWFFRGTSIGHTSEITVLDTTGAIVQSISTTLNNMSTIYGAIFLNGQLYIGQGTVGAMLYPVNISGNTATLGTPISIPVTLTDLANCNLTETSTGIGESPEQPNISLQMEGASLKADVPASGRLCVYTTTGALLKEQHLEKGSCLVGIAQTDGILFWNFVTTNGQHFTGKLFSGKL